MPSKLTDNRLLILVILFGVFVFYGWDTTIGITKALLTVIVLLLFTLLVGNNTWLSHVVFALFDLIELPYPWVATILLNGIFNGTFRGASYLWDNVFAEYQIVFSCLILGQIARIWSSIGQKTGHPPVPAEQRRQPTPRRPRERGPMEATVEGDDEDEEPPAGGRTRTDNAPDQPPPPRAEKAGEEAPQPQGPNMTRGPRWTRIRRPLVAPEVLHRAGLRYETQPDFIHVPKALGEQELGELARATAAARPVGPGVVSRGPAGAGRVRFRSTFISPEVLYRTGVRYEVRGGLVTVHKALSDDRLAGLARETAAAARARRRHARLDVDPDIAFAGWDEAAESFADPAEEHAAARGPSCRGPYIRRNLRPPPRSYDERPREKPGPVARYAFGDPVVIDRGGWKNRTRSTKLTLKKIFKEPPARVDFGGAARNKKQSRAAPEARPDGGPGRKAHHAARPAAPPPAPGAQGPPPEKPAPAPGASSRAGNRGLRSAMRADNTRETTGAPGKSARFHLSVATKLPPAGGLTDAANGRRRLWKAAGAAGRLPGHHAEYWLLAARHAAYHNDLAPGDEGAAPADARAAYDRWYAEEVLGPRARAAARFGAVVHEQVLAIDWGDADPGVEVRDVGMGFMAESDPQLAEDPQAEVARLEVAKRLEAARSQEAGADELRGADAAKAEEAEAVRSEEANNAETEEATEAESSRPEPRETEHEAEERRMMRAIEARHETVIQQAAEQLAQALRGLYEAEPTIPPLMSKVTSSKEMQEIQRSEAALEAHFRHAEAWLRADGWVRYNEALLGAHLRHVAAWLEADGWMRYDMAVVRSLSMSPNTAAIMQKSAAEANNRLAAKEKKAAARRAAVRKEYVQRGVGRSTETRNADKKRARDLADSVNLYEIDIKVAIENVVTATWQKGAATREEVRQQQDSVRDAVTGLEVSTMFALKAAQDLAEHQNAVAAKQAKRREQPSQAERKRMAKERVEQAAENKRAEAIGLSGNLYAVEAPVAMRRHGNPLRNTLGVSLEKQAENERVYNIRHLTEHWRVNLIDTPGSALLCGLHAIHLSWGSQLGRHSGGVAPTVAELQGMVAELDAENQAVLEAIREGLGGNEEAGEDIAGAENMLADKMGGVLRRCGQYLAGQPVILLGVLRQEGDGWVPEMLGNETNALVLWVHNDEAVRHGKGGMNHFSGVEINLDGLDPSSLSPRTPGTPNQWLLEESEESGESGEKSVLEG